MCTVEQSIKSGPTTMSAKCHVKKADLDLHVVHSLSQSSEDARHLSVVHGCIQPVQQLAPAATTDPSYANCRSYKMQFAVGANLHSRVPHCRPYSVAVAIIKAGDMPQHSPIHVPFEIQKRSSGPIFGPCQDRPLYSEGPQVRPSVLECLY